MSDNQPFLAQSILRDKLYPYNDLNAPEVEQVKLKHQLLSEEND